MWCLELNSTWNQHSLISTSVSYKLSAPTSTRYVSLRHLNVFTPRHKNDCNLVAHSRLWRPVRYSCFCLQHQGGSLLQSEPWRNLVFLFTLFMVLTTLKPVTSEGVLLRICMWLEASLRVCLSIEEQNLNWKQISQEAISCRKFKIRVLWN